MLSDIYICNDISMFVNIIAMFYSRLIGHYFGYMARRVDGNKNNTTIVAALYYFLLLFVLD